MATVGDRIRAARLDMGMTQKQLADAITKINPEFGGAQSTIQAIEGGKSKKPTILYEISRVLHVSVEHLRYGKEKTIVTLNADDYEDDGPEIFIPTKLEIENRRLRSENEMLRKMLKNLL